jgi:hypothetical protein
MQDHMSTYPLRRNEAREAVRAAYERVRQGRGVPGGAESHAEPPRACIGRTARRSRNTRATHYSCDASNIMAQSSPPALDDLMSRWANPKLKNFDVVNGMSDIERDFL